MKSMKRTNPGEDYLCMYPKLRKWINECEVCHSRGYDLALPEEIYPYFSVAAATLKELFCPLELNDEDLCATCSKVQKK